MSRGGRKDICEATIGNAQCFDIHGDLSLILVFYSNSVNLLNSVKFLNIIKFDGACYFCKSQLY